MTEQERNLIRDAMMFAVKDITGRVIREATVQSMINDFKKAINYTHCCEQLTCYNDNIIDKSLTLNKKYEKIHEHNGMVVIINDYDEVMSYNRRAFFKVG